MGKIKMGKIEMGKIKWRNFLGALGCAPITWLQAGANELWIVASGPARYTASPNPMQNYFALKSGPKQAWLYPGFTHLGFTPPLTNQPYSVVPPA